MAQVDKRKVTLVLRVKTVERLKKFAAKPDISMSSLIAGRIDALIAADEE